jgi:hypothetical protein
MNSKQRKTLEAIFFKPAPKNLLWNDIESLFKSINCQMEEGAGSRVSFRYTVKHDGKPDEEVQGDFHRPHPGKEAKPFQVKKVVVFLLKTGQLP